MAELTAEGTNLLEEKDNIQKEEETNQMISLKKRLLLLSEALIFDDGVHGIVSCDL